MTTFQIKKISEQTLKSCELFKYGTAENNDPRVYTINNTVQYAV